MGTYAQGGGWSGPERQYQGIPQFSPIIQAMQDAQRARAAADQPGGGGGGGRAIQVSEDPDTAQEAFWAQQATHNPDIVGPGQSRLSSDASPSEWERAATQPRSFQVGGRPYQIDPRMGLGLELAKQRQARSGQVQVQADESQIRQRESEARVQRLVGAGYSQKEAVRQVFGGPRTVAEEQEVINTRSADQLSRDKMIQGEISARAAAAQGARAGLSTLLERSRSGDRNASRQLRAQQMLFQDATRAHADALKARTSNALGADVGAPAMDPADAQLQAAVNEHLDDVQSTEAARQGAIAGVAKAASAGAPGADNISDKDAAAFLGVRHPAVLNDGSSPVAGDPMAKWHRGFSRGVLPGQTGAGQGLKPAPKPLEEHMHAPAASDPAYRQWLQGKGYDVSTVKPPQDDQQDDEEF